MRCSQWYVIALMLAVSGCESNTEPATSRSKQTAADAEKVVRSVISKFLKVDASAIPMDRPISDPPLKADDLDLIEIVMELEDKQGIQIPDASLDRYAGKNGPVRITPNQLVAIVVEASTDQPSKAKK